MRGNLQFKYFIGPLTRKPVRYGIYLPEEYFSRPDHNFAVLYFLHGLNQDHTANLETVAAALESAVRAAVVRPMLVVTPDGYVNSMWADSKSGHKPAETNLIRELMPHVEKSYRCVTDRAHRIIGGFSMGGYGACRNAVKYPELFTTCFSMDGALHTLDTLKRIRGPVFTEIFADDEDYFRRYCLFALAAQNRFALDGHLFHILVGVLKSFNDRFRRRFGELGLIVADAHYHLTGCGHDAACILEKSGNDLFALVEKRMAAGEAVAKGAQS